MSYKAIGARIAAANNVVNPTNLAPALPASVVGDVLLAITSCRSITATVATPAGWTLVAGFPKRSATASGGTIYVFSKKVVGGETSPTLAWSGVTTGTSGDASQAVVVCLDNDDVLDVTVPNPSDASGAHPSIPDVTSSTIDTTVLGIAIKISDTAQTGTIANSFTERGDFHTTSGTGHHLYIATRQMAAPGATGASTVTESNATAARYLAVALVFKKRPVMTHYGAISRTITFGATTAGFIPGAPINSPADLPGLTNWYKADALALSDGAAVTALTDSSGQGRDLTGNATFKTNQLNGLPGVEFNGTTDYLTYLSGTSFVVGKEVTVFAVMRQIAGVSNGRMLSFNATDDIDYQTPSWCIYNGGAGDRIAPYSNGELAVQVPNPAGATLMTTWFGADDTHNLRVDGAPSSASQTTTAQMQPFTSFETKRFTLGMGWLGGPSSGGNYVFHEIVIYDRELDGNERLQVETYLNDKWFVTAGPTTHYGATSTAISFASTTAGRRQTFGQLVRPFTFGVVIDGRRKAFGQIALPITFSKAVDGTRKTFGQLLSPFVFGKAVAGTRQTFSQIAFPISASIATAGFRVGLRLYGALSLPITFNKDIRGQRKAFGQVALPITFSKDVRGQRKTFGQISLPIIFTKEAVGRKNVFGQLSMQTLFGKETAGRRKTFSQLAFPLTFSKTVTGQRKTFGKIALPINTTIVVDGFSFTGPKTYYGEIALPIAFGKQVTAQRRTFGQITAPFLFGVASQGQRQTFSGIELPIDFETMIKSGPVGVHGVLDLDLVLTMDIDGNIRIVGVILNDALELYLGEKNVLAAYVGSENVWLPK